jgi:hypothetical protein
MNKKIVKGSFRGLSFYYVLKILVIFGCKFLKINVDIVENEWFTSLDLC